MTPLNFAVRRTDDRAEAGGLPTTWRWELLLNDEAVASVWAGHDTPVPVVARRLMANWTGVRA